MPKESATPLNRGPGSTSPDFTAPSVGVATPGRQLQAPTTEAEAFRDAILTFGQGVASAVSARATINNRIKALKETSMRKVEADLARSARGFQARRLDKVDRERQAIIAEAGEKGMEWAERQLRQRMANASSAQEARIWESSWSKASAQVSRDNAEAKRQSFNQAKMTMQQVSISLSEELQESPELQQTLIGDGTGINGRTQDWMLQRVQQDVDMDSLTEEDAEFLIHQTVVQSARIGDQLRDKNTKAVEDSNARLGARQMDADLFSTMTGEQDPVHVRAQIETTLRDRFNHLTLAQQDEMVKQTVATNLQKLASGEFGLDNFESLETARQMLDLTVNGRKVFDRAERAQIEAKLLEQAEGTLSRAMETRVAEAMESFSTVITLPDGQQVRKADFNAQGLLTTPDPDTGVSPLDRIAEDVLTLSGSDDPRLVAAVRRQQAQLAAQAQRGQAKKIDTATTVYNTVTGGISENPTSAGNTTHHNMAETRAMRTPAELRGMGQDPMSAQEIAHLKEAYRGIINSQGGDPALVDQWNGETIGTDHPLRKTADMMQAAIWNQEGVVKNTGIPPALVRSKVALLTSDNPQDLQSFINFASALEGGAEGSWQKFLQSGELSESQRGAAIYHRTVAHRGRAAFDANGDPHIQSTEDEAVDINRLHAETRQLLGAPMKYNWVWNQADRDSPMNATVMAQHWAQAIMSGDRAGNYRAADWDANEEDLTAALVKTMQTDTALANWVSALYQSQSALDNDLSIEQISALALGYMEKDGLRIKQTTDGGLVVMRDPAGHTGPAGGNIDQHAEEKMHAIFPTWYRVVLQEALDLKPYEVPENNQGLFLLGRKGVVRNGEIFPDAERDLTPQDMKTRGVLFAEYSNSELDNQRRLDSREVGGGSVLHATLRDGTQLQMPVALRDTHFLYPDGSPGFIAEGQILPVVNSDFTPSPAPTVRGVGYASPYRAPVGPVLNIPAP